MVSRTVSTARLVGAMLAALALAACATPGPIEQNVSPDFTYDVQVDRVGTDSIAFFEDGRGQAPTTVLMHGIPVSSALWRNVAPIVAEAGPVMAFDLPGYGRSSLPANGDFSYQSLYDPMAAWLDRQDAPFVLVVTDLGSLLGIDYAMRNPDRVRGLVLMEAAYMPAREWAAQLTPLQQAVLPAMRWDAFADFMIVNQPRFQRLALDMGTVRDLSPEEEARYLDVYDDVERRRVVREGPGPTTMPRGAVSQMPGDMVDVMNRNAAALAQSDIPMLLLTADPGMIVQPEAVAYALENFRDLTIREVGAGRHFLPEDQPTAVGEAIRDWLVETGFSDARPRG